jgi:hypothetical protein
MLRIYDVPYFDVNCLSIGSRRNSKGIVGNLRITIVKFSRTICLIYTSLWFYTNKNIIFL